MKRTILVLVCGLFVPGANGQSQWPPDVASFIERRDGCDHFRGEYPYDEERRKFLRQNILELCVGTDRQLALLKKRHRDNKAVIAKLDEYESRIELGRDQ